MRVISVVLPCILATGSTIAAQQPAAVRADVYRLEFSVHELENGKRVNSRNYTMLVEDGGKGTIRVGTRVPVPTGTGANTQYQYMDVGLNLDCTLRERENQIFLHTSVEISDLATPDPGKAPGAGPSIRQVRATVPTAVLPGQRTVICTLDDVVGKRRYDLEVMAAKVK